MFAYCLDNPINRVDGEGSVSYDCMDDDPNNDNNPLNDAGVGGNSNGGSSNGGSGGGGKQITLYRAVSPAESNSANTTQKFSPGNNSYEDIKFFATSQADAQKWGNGMYKDGNYEIISGTFHSEVITAPGVVYYPWLDGIGAAYSIPISALNNSVILISWV